MQMQASHQDDTATIYYHGGFPGLTPGESITPRGHRPEPGHPIFGKIGNSSKVYVTTDLDTARSYAAQWNRLGGGAVYQVIPENLSPDPDSAHDFNLEADYATIVTVTIAYVAMSFLEISRIQGPGKRWATADDHVYDPDGWLQLAPEWEAAGYTQADLRRLGTRWAPVELVELLISELRRVPTAGEFRQRLTELERTLATHRPPAP